MKHPTVRRAVPFVLAWGIVLAAALPAAAAERAPRTRAASLWERGRTVLAALTGFTALWGEQGWMIDPMGNQAASAAPGSPASPTAVWGAQGGMIDPNGNPVPLAAGTAGDRKGSLLPHP